MAWTARVVEKLKSNGQLQVVVEYANGATTFREALVSRSKQDQDWLADAVKRRLADLADVDTLKDAIPDGPVAVLPDVKPNATPKEIYERKFRRFEAWLGLMRQGIVAVDRPAFVTLKQWLIDNWDDAYLDIFLR
jgi:hypothetical protein